MRRLWLRYAERRLATWTEREHAARHDLHSSIAAGNLLAERIAEAHVTAATAKRRQWAATVEAAER